MHMNELLCIRLHIPYWSPSLADLNGGTEVGTGPGNGTGTVKNRYGSATLGVGLQNVVDIEVALTNC